MADNSKVVYVNNLITHERYGLSFSGLDIYTFAHQGGESAIDVVGRVISVFSSGSLGNAVSLG